MDHQNINHERIFWDITVNVQDTQPIICQHYFYSIDVTYVNRAHTHLGKGKE